MRKLIVLIMCCSAVSVTLTNCKKETAPVKESSVNTLSKANINLTKWNKLRSILKEKNLSKIGKARINTQSVSYTELCVGETYSAEATPNSIFDASQFHYYSFEGKAGDDVTIYAKRTGNCAMDPAFSVYYGTTNDFTDVYYFDGGANMTFLEFSDDEELATCGFTCFADPLLSGFVLPYTGKYTVAVFDFASCGPSPLTYELTINGIVPCTIVIDGCDSKVANNLLPSGNFMLEEILALAKGVKNHGQFVSQVTKLTNAWVAAKRITGKEKGRIMSCVSSSRIGKQKK